MAAAQVNFRIDPDVLERIDHNATQRGMSRTDYILSYLPENYERDAKQPLKPATDQRR